MMPITARTAAIQTFISQLPRSLRVDEEPYLLAVGQVSVFPSEPFDIRGVFVEKEIRVGVAPPVDVEIFRAGVVGPRNENISVPVLVDVGEYQTLGRFRKVGQRSGKIKGRVGLRRILGAVVYDGVEVFLP